MELQVAVLCDAATDYGGKLNLLGTFDTIHAARLPAIHPQCSIAMRMTFNKVEEGTHRVRINFVDEDGKSVLRAKDPEGNPVFKPIELALPVQVPDETHFVSRNLVVTMQNIQFEKAGLYAVDIAVDGRQEGSIPLLVKVVAAKEGPI